MTEEEIEKICERIACQATKHIDDEDYHRFEQVAFNAAYTAFTEALEWMNAKNK